MPFGNLPIPARCAYISPMNKVKLGIVLLLSVGSTSSIVFAQCHDASSDGTSAGSTAGTSSVAVQVAEEHPAVLLTLTLGESGAVRDAKVLRGPVALRAPAIQAAKRRKYREALHSWPFSKVIMVEVTFPHGDDGAPEIRQAMPAGVSSCVYVDRIRISPEVMQTYLLEKVDPMNLAGVQKDGAVILRVHIEKDGSVSSAEKVTGPDALAPAAIDAVKKWRYRPYELNGEPAKVETTVEVEFSN